MRQNAYVQGARTAGLAYAAALALLCFIVLAGWQSYALDQSLERQTQISDAIIAHRAGPGAIAQLHAQRAHTHFLARAGLFASAAFVPIVGLWIAGFSFTIRRARIDRSHAMKDALTGAGNRRSALAKLRALSSNEPEFGVIFIDLDGFKKINDVSGHAAGDAILQQVAQRLLQELRSVDSVCRLGGDEFVCIVSPPTTPAAVHAIAERLRKTVAHTYALSDDDYVLDCSIGVSIFPHDGRDAHVLLERADRAMYSAKADGGGVRSAAALIERQLPI